ncbi:MAG: hypothetical protein EA398_13525 [Deltaproteobacteria bacterium]|nr:MAG: hypothetical protein EA398_13525 [Deltaproteobacteria bacterium]
MADKELTKEQVSRFYLAIKRLQHAEEAVRSARAILDAREQNVEDLRQSIDSMIVFAGGAGGKLDLANGLITFEDDGEE